MPVGVIIHKLLAAAPRRLCAVFFCYSANICAAAYLHLCGACSWGPRRWSGSHRHFGKQRWGGGGTHQQNWGLLSLPPPPKQALAVSPVLLQQGWRQEAGELQPCGYQAGPCTVPQKQSLFPRNPLGFWSWVGFWPDFGGLSREGCTSSVVAASPRCRASRWLRWRWARSLHSPAGIARGLGFTLPRWRL